MLTAIRVGNFKAFAETQLIPIRPLTLIYGANSSGKSSILHSLILARHAQETGDLDVHLTSVGGTAVDLGGFKQYVHTGNHDHRVELAWEISTESLPDRLSKLLPGVQRIGIGVQIGLIGIDPELLRQFGAITPHRFVKALLEAAQEKGDDTEAKRLESHLESAENELTIEEALRLRSRPEVEKIWLDLDGRTLSSLSARPQKHFQLDFFDTGHEAAKFIIRNLILAHSTSESVEDEEFGKAVGFVDEIVPKVAFDIEKLFPNILSTMTKDAPTKADLLFITVRKETRLEDLNRVLEHHFPRVLGEILTGISSLIEAELGKLWYLGPLRAYPPRHFGQFESRDANWIAGGGWAWDAIKKDGDLRKKVNEWLGNENKLSTNYELAVRHLLTIEGIKNKFSELASKAVSNLNFLKESSALEEDDPDRTIYGTLGDVEDEIHVIIDKLQRLESLYSEMPELVLMDKRTRTAVTHRDVGIGISQVLPVLVNSYGSTDKLLAMEQPEIHLHPALQAELGDVFIESALGDRKNTLLIETHSEHLLLRVMRRMRETSSGTLPAGVPQITPADVCVLFVDPDGSRSIVREMPLNEHGELVKAWPGGFFEEGIREMF
jgi:hypothetical protein